MVDTYYPGVPHQLDTTHFLTNASKPLETEDLALQTGLPQGRPQPRRAQDHRGKAGPRDSRLG